MINHCTHKQDVFSEKISKFNMILGFELPPNTTHENIILVL